MVNTDKQPWIKYDNTLHSAGIYPVPKQTLVDVKTADGKEYTDKASGFYWSSEDETDQPAIVAYRITRLPLRIVK